MRAMVRTLISLEAEEKAWLEKRAREEGVSMAELVRRAVRRMRSEGGGEGATTAELLTATSGTIAGEDGLVVQKRLRGEWDRPC